MTQSFGISGFTYCRNAMDLDYPRIESIHSILPIVDEYIVLLGESNDKTYEAIEKIGDPKIRVIPSTWDETQKSEGRVMSSQATLTLSHCQFPWAFHLQADEVIHEENIPHLQPLMKENLENERVLGFSFRFIHFLLDYESINPWAF